MHAKPTMAQLHELHRDGKLAAFQCAACKRTQAAPMVRCTCGGEDIGLKELPSQGRVESFTIQRVAAEEFINDVPYAWAVIKLDDGTCISGWIGYVSEPKDLALGARVRFVPGYKPGLQFEKA
ncbi:MAG TPA: OB-fold domain-containing protein [Candidatus Thermoplasmatota archaeon]|jgi:uncharacterized OB-fold protein|nr:OB-fold domain-containing protein [Candidatus Thermoplasmatota archaeon]